METNFPWNNQIHSSSGGLATNLNFQNEHATRNLDADSFSWTQENQNTWNVPEGCPPKRLKLEEHLQDRSEDNNFQSFYLNPCFQNSGDPHKDSSRFSYLPQAYLPQGGGEGEGIGNPRRPKDCNVQQAPTSDVAMSDVKVKSNSSEEPRFYEQTNPVYPQQFACYATPENSGFLEGMFGGANTSMPADVGTYDSAEQQQQYGFDPSTGRFIPTASFFSPTNQGEGIASAQPMVPMDPQTVAMAPNAAAKMYQHQQRQQQPQHTANTQLTVSQLMEPQRHRNAEETASISSNSSVNGAGGMSTSAYFWQYNAQCKGPKAVRLINGGANSPISNSTSPLSSCYDGNSGLCVGNCSIAAHSLPQYPLVVFEDPVQKRNDLVHCSKLRRGDGNDVTPNILRLRSMGDELDRLAAQITRQGEIIMAGGGAASVGNGVDMNGIIPPNGYEMDHGAPPSWRVEEAKREKNKLASKICRLKKKAFHESNKIKYTGLGLEYKELASLITSLKKMISQRASPSLARLLQQSQQTGEEANSGNGETDKLPQGIENDQNSTLLSRAKWLATTTHVTRVAGRMDAFVEEVLNLAKTTQAKHPLIKRLSSGCNSTVALTCSNQEIAAPPIPKYSSMETQLSHLPFETQEQNFAYTTHGGYEYTQRHGFTPALDLSNMLRSGSSDQFIDYQQTNYDGIRQVEWSEYTNSAIYNGSTMAEEGMYDASSYSNAYHHHTGTHNSQEFVANCPPNFNDTAEAVHAMNGYQSLQPVSGNLVEGELTNLPASADVSNAENGINAVNCPQRLSVLT